ncbi:hypothetical protein LCGC14_0416030 [marine sediment metagenome]|uniref:Uncharacterized protein n=1 Tax=marine sediment metagenome TaxID=412755 RepID=A0A0F9TAF7_9ZZZZ
MKDREKFRKYRGAKHTCYSKNKKNAWVIREKTYWLCNSIFWSFVLGLVILALCILLSGCSQEMGSRYELHIIDLVEILQ